MRISTKGQYAVRLMVEIAKSDELVSISNVAKSQEISQKYLEQIVSKLVKANLLESTRGHMGGYSLTKSANEISVKEIFSLQFLFINSTAKANPSGAGFVLPVSSGPIMQSKYESI